MRLLVFILALIIPLCSCGCNFTEEVNLTGVCYDKEAYDYDGSLVPIKDLEVSTGCPCNSDKINYTDENGRFSVKQCFEDADNGHSFLLTVGSWFTTKIYKDQTISYTYNTGDSTIDVGEIYMEKY